MLMSTEEQADQSQGPRITVWPAVTLVVVGGVGVGGGGGGCVCVCVCFKSSPANHHEAKGLY